MIEVARITEAATVPFLLKQHYAQRRCPISYAFGAYRGAELIGVITYGVPVSSPLRAGICGPEYAGRNMRATS